MRRLDRVLAALLVIGLAIALLRDMDEPGERRPAPEPPPLTEDGNLPGAQSADPIFLIEMLPKTNNVSGTAFSIGPGLWLTADHVTGSCREVFIETAGGYMEADRVVAHGRADVAVLETPRSGPAVPLSATLDVNQAGYHVGFPHGEPGEILSALIGRARMRVQGATSREEPVVAWAESRRRPDSLADLGGISGGPAFDGAGHVVGVTVGGSQRRGTVITAAPASIREVVARAGVVPAPSLEADRFRPTPQRLTSFGDHVRDALTVAKVICLVDRPSRRPLSR